MVHKITNSIKVLIIITFVCFLGTNPCFAFDSRAVKLYNEGMDLNFIEKNADAIVCFEQAVKIDPTFTEAYRALAATYEKTGDTKSAVRTYEILFGKTMPDYELAYKIALYYKESGDKDKAVFYLKKIPPENALYKKARELAASMDMTLDVDKNIRVSTFGTGSKKVINSEKILIEKFMGPAGIAKDGSGNIYVADYSDNSIVQINNRGEKRVLFKGKPINGPLGLAIDIFNNIYVANYNSDEILKISLKNNSIKVLYRNINKPYYLMVDSCGYLYVTEQGKNTLSKLKVF